MPKTPRFLSVLFLSLLVCARALTEEEIIGGYSAAQTYFKYHAGVIGKYSTSQHRYLIGNAAIVSEFLLVGSGKSFMLSYDTIKKFTFFALIGVDILTPTTEDLKEIDAIYLYQPSFRLPFSSDLAVIKLQDFLDLPNLPNLVALEIPDEEERFYDERAIVSGYGISTVNEFNSLPNHKELRFTTNRNQFLRYAEAIIVRDGNLENAYNTTSYKTVCHGTAATFTELCGKIPADDTYDSQRGLCLGDVGAPLVVGNKLVGIASSYNMNCDDTEHGALYTKVANYKGFIEAMKAENPIQGTACYENKPLEKNIRQQKKKKAIRQNGSYSAS